MPRLGLTIGGVFSNDTYSMIKFLLICTVLAMATGCTYNNTQDLYGGVTAPCDTSAVTFSQDISEILTQNCVICHNDNDPIAGVNLEGHSNASAWAVLNTFMNRVELPLGDPLLMPPSGPLSLCDQSKLRAWISEGAPNN